ncbi:MAG: hypothetical protein V1494_05285 [Candidatus Diapherotrites archaeon]
MNLDKVIACFKELGFTPVVDEFADRLIIQKSVYLLDLKGIKTGFNFNLYMRGPYSKELTDQIYENKTKVQNLDCSSNISKSETKFLEEFREVFGELKPSILEVASTYSFFAFEEKQDPITALKNVKKMKSFYSEPQIAIGISKAKEFLFRPSEKDLADLRQELKPWQEASAKTIRG